MRINSIQFPIWKPYNKPAIEIYVAGCTHNCKGCCNPELADFNNGSPFIISELIAYLKEREALFDVISILGGDLLCQPEEEQLELAEALYLAFKDKELWLFTGFDDFDKIPDYCSRYFDVIKYGSYREDLKQEGFPASSNQVVSYKEVKEV